VAAPDRPRLFAAYNLAAIFTAALGALASGLPEVLAHREGWDVTTAQRSGFVLYALLAVVILALYRGLARSVAPPPAADRPPRRVLHSSRHIVLELAALFSLDSAGSGFVVTSLLVLWLHLRFDLSAATTGAVFFAAGLLGACSQALAPRLARRIGLIRTMAYTHIPANCLLVLAAFAPSGGVAIALLLARALFAQMDVPARQAFVMAVVPPDERAAAASVTNVPRSLASALTPLLAGLLLERTTFGWPLVIAGLTKVTYDLTLLGLYHDVPEQEGARRGQPSPSASPAPSP
jgi:predicted MFS family arabinose efflux permease